MDVMSLVSELSCDKVWVSKVASISTISARPLLPTMNPVPPWIWWTEETSSIFFGSHTCSELRGKAKHCRSPRLVLATNFCAEEQRVPLALEWDVSYWMFFQKVTRHTSAIQSGCFGLKREFVHPRCCKRYSVRFKVEDKQVRHVLTRYHDDGT